MKLGILFLLALLAGLGCRTAEPTDEVINNDQTPAGDAVEAMIVDDNDDFLTSL